VPARPTSPVLDVSHLRLERGSNVILHGISWRVERGQHWVILGPNGCGKTSLLKALTAYMTPSRGSVELLGRSFCSPARLGRRQDRCHAWFAPDRQDSFRK
jgi:iron complex transport system ATP-binding protein